MKGVVEILKASFENSYKLLRNFSIIAQIFKTVGKLDSEKYYLPEERESEFTCYTRLVKMTEDK